MNREDIASTLQERSVELLESSSGSNHDIALLNLLRQQVTDRLKSRGLSPDLVLVELKGDQVEIKSTDGSPIRELLGYEEAPPPPKAEEEFHRMNRAERRRLMKGRRRG